MGIGIAVPLRKGTKQLPPIVEPEAKPLSSCAGSRKPENSVFCWCDRHGFGNDLRPCDINSEEQDCDRLIVDFRQYRRELGIARLASYMCPAEYPIGHSFTPKRLRTGWIPRNFRVCRCPDETGTHLQVRTVRVSRQVGDADDPGTRASAIPRADPDSGERVDESAAKPCQLRGGMGSQSVAKRPAATFWPPLISKS